MRASGIPLPCLLRLANAPVTEKAAPASSTHISMATAQRRPRCHLLPASASSPLRLREGGGVDGPSSGERCDLLAIANSWAIDVPRAERQHLVMSSGKWQNGSIPPKLCSALPAADISPTPEAADDLVARKEAAVKGNIVKTYDYKLSVGSDDLASRSLNEDNCSSSSSLAIPPVSGHVSQPGHNLLASSEAAAAETVATSAPRPPPGTVGYNQDMLLAYPRHGGTASAAPAAATAAVEDGHCCPVAGAACHSGQPRNGSSGAVAELAARRSAAGGSRWQSESSGLCDFSSSATLSAADSKCGGSTVAVAPVKDFVQFFESRHDIPDSPKKFVPAAAAAAAAAPSRALVTDSVPGNHRLPAGDGPLLSSKESEVRSPRAPSLRSNPAPLDTQQSLVRLCCVASGYGKYMPKSAALARSSQSDTAAVVDTHIASSGDHQPLTMAKAGAATVRSESALEYLSEAARNAADLERNSLRGGKDSATPGESRCSNLGDGDAGVISNGQAQAACGSVCVGDSDVQGNGTDKTADSISSPKAGDEFLARVLNEEQRLNGLSQLSSNDVNTNTLPEEVSGLLRSAIGKANLLVCKKFKQFKELCNKNMTQAADERYKTTAEDLQGFWDMMMLQVEDVDRVFSEIAQLRANGWQCDSCDVKDAASAADSAREIGAKSNDSPVAFTATPRPKTTPARRLVGSTPENRNRKASAAAATPASKAREEARQRLLAAKKAMRRSSSNEDSGSAGAADVVVFLGGGVTAS